VQKDLCSIFKFEKNTCRYFVWDPDSCSPASQKVTESQKNLRKAQNAGEPMPDFPNLTKKHLQNFFQLRRSKKVIKVEKRSVRF
jgi:hypothetical protein